MGNEESGQSGDYGQLGAASGMMSSSYNTRTNQPMNVGPISTSFPGGMRANQMSGSVNRPLGPSSMSRGPGPPPPAVPAIVPDVDLSGLTEEEKMMIQSVMARAQEETSAGPAVQPIMNKPIPSSAPTIGYPEQRRMPSRDICPLCRQELLDIILGPKCLDCSRVVCLKCGHHLPAGPDGKSQIWVCNECAKRRPPPVIPPAQTTRHYNDSYYNTEETSPPNQYQHQQQQHPHQQQHHQQQQQQPQSGPNYNQNYSNQMQNQIQYQPQYQSQQPQQQIQPNPQQQRSHSQSNINPQLRALPRTSSLEQQSSYDQQKYEQSMQPQPQQQPYHHQQQQQQQQPIQQQYHSPQQQQQQFESPTRQRNVIKGPSHPPPNQTGLTHNQIQQNYDQDRDMALESQQQVKQNQLYQPQSDQWPSATTTREYSSNDSPKSYTSTEMLFSNDNNKRLVDNNENAMNVENNNEDINSEFNNIGGHISGQKSTSMAANSQDNELSMFSFVTSKALKNAAVIQDQMDDNEDDYEDSERRFQCLDAEPDYSDDFDIDEDYEREGEFDDESDEEEGDMISSAATTTVFGMSDFDRSLGEVYTIPEEDEELSPQINGKKKNGSHQFKLSIDNDLNSDTAATLQRWRGVGNANQSQWNQSQAQQQLLQQQPVQQPTVPSSGTGRKMPQMPQLNQNQTLSSAQQQIQKQQFSEQEYRPENRQYSQDSGQQNQPPFQQQIQKNQYTQDIRPDIRSDIRQDIRQDMRQDIRPEQRFLTQDNNRQFPQNQRQDNLQTQQIQNQSPQEYRQELRQELRQSQLQDKNYTQESKHIIQTDQSQQNINVQNYPQTQQQPKQQQIYNQEDYQRYQSQNAMRNITSQPSDVYQTHPSTTSSGMRDIKQIEMGSPSSKTGQAMPQIPRTVPLHMVTQQLATSTSLASSPPSSNTSSPKHKPIQSQSHSQQTQQLQPKKIPPQIQECWSPPTDLSPILDVSPSIEAAEQEIMENIKTTGDQMPMITNIPRATSGTITGMIADFNKAMEALGTTSPTEEQYQIASKLKQLQKNTQNHKQKQQLIQNTAQIQPQNQSIKQTSIQDKKNPIPSSSGQKMVESMVNTSTQQPIIVMTSGPNQSTIPLQLQLNPQAVPATALLPSPQVEQQLQQQQILIQQQQQFLQIQIEQQKLQKQMQEQMAVKQQQDMDKQKQKDIIEQQLTKAKQEIVKQDKQVSTSTPPSITSTPTSSMSKAVTSSTAIAPKNSDPILSNMANKRSLHRRLPHATTEEMQTAVLTLAAQNVSRTSAPSVSTITSQRPISPLMPRKSQSSVIPSQAIIGSLGTNTRRTILSTSTNPTTSITSLVSSTAIPSTSTSMYPRVSPSPYGGYTSVLRSHTPITPGGDYSDSQSDASGDKGKRRKLPSVPWDEEPVSPILATRKLIKERLAGRPLVSSTSLASKRIPPLRPSSSLDSATGMPSHSRRPQSPFSSASDITQFLTSTYGQSVMKSPIGNLRSPARSPIPAGESQIGRLQTSHSSSSLTSPTRFPSYMKNIKHQLWEELKTATEEKQRLLSLRDRDQDFYRRSETDLQTLYDIYSSPVRRRRGRYRKNASDSKIYRHSSNREDIPFKSYEFESLNPTRSGIELSYRQQRPMSSMGSYSDAELGLRESVIPNYMDSDDNELYMAANSLSQRVRRRSLGSAEMTSRFGYGLDPYGRSSSKYYYDDLTQQRRRIGGRPSRSWNPSPYVSEDEDDQLTREEKAAKVRAEIKRRRQQMADSGRLYRHSIDGSDRLNYRTDDIYSQSALTSDDYYNYPSALHQMPRDYYYGRLKPNYSQPSLHGQQLSDNYSYHPSYNPNQNYDPRMVNMPDPRLAHMHGVPGYPPGTSQRDAALLRRPNFAHPDIGSIMSTDTDTPSEFMEPMHSTPAMPILPDMPTRSRKLIEDLGSSSIGGGGHRSGYSHLDHNVIRGSPKKTQFAPNTTKYPKYPFPVKRILLTQDPKIRSVSGNGLGLKVVGGKEIPGSNMIGAYIQKIHPSLTMMGEIREGMQVIEWNGIPLTGISHDEVSRIISNQVGDEIEVVIRTDINMIQSQYQSYDQPPAYPQVILQHNHPIDDSHQQIPHPQHSHQQQYQQQSHNTQIANIVDPQDVDLIDQQSVDANVNDDENKFDINDEQLGKIRGELQLQICYDMKAAILYVTIIEAQNLMTLSNGQFPDPFVKCYLLPPRIVDNQRRTRYFYQCMNPKWKQTMVYPNIKLDDFKKKYLELSVWSFSIYSPHVFLGQIAIDLSDKFITDEESHWYRLGGFVNESKHKSSSSKLSNIDKRSYKQDINLEKWQFETESYSLGRPPIIATSTRSKLTIFGERLNRHLDRRRSASSTESSRLTNISQLSTTTGHRSRVIPILPQTNITAPPLLQHGCHGALCSIL